jgi:cytochrome c553
MTMNRLCSVLVLAVAASASAAHAQGIEEKAQVCAPCHGDDGTPPAQPFPVPVIWGQNLGYLFFQLRDFRSGARASDQMTAVAAALASDDLMPLAQYFAKKQWPSLAQPRPAADVATLAQRINASAGCAGCHQPEFKGGTQPRLAGQVRAYLQKTMKDFQTGARANNPAMSGLTKGLTDHDFDALASWLAGM